MEDQGNLELAALGVAALLYLGGILLALRGQGMPSMVVILLS